VKTCTECEVEGVKQAKENLYNSHKFTVSKCTGTGLPGFD